MVRFNSWAREAEVVWSDVLAFRLRAPGPGGIRPVPLPEPGPGDVFVVTLRCGVEGGRPAVVTVSVVGRVELAPADPLDERIAGAFNDHQRRTTGGCVRTEQL